MGASGSGMKLLWETGSIVALYRMFGTGLARKSNGW